MDGKLSSEQIKKMADDLGAELKRYNDYCRDMHVVYENFSNDLKPNPYDAAHQDEEAAALSKELKTYSENYEKAKEIVNAKFGALQQIMYEYVAKSTQAQAEASSDLENLTATLDSTQDMFN